MHWCASREQMWYQTQKTTNSFILGMIKHIYVKRRKTINNYNTMHNTNGLRILSRIWSQRLMESQVKRPPGQRSLYLARRTLQVAHCSTHPLSSLCTSLRAVLLERAPWITFEVRIEWSQESVLGKRKDVCLISHVIEREVIILLIQEDGNLQWMCLQWQRFFQKMFWELKARALYPSPFFSRTLNFLKESVGDASWVYSS